MGIVICTAAPVISAGYHVKLRHDSVEVKELDLVITIKNFSQQTEKFKGLWFDTLICDEICTPDYIESLNLATHTEDRNNYYGEIYVSDLHDK